MTSSAHDTGSSDFETLARQYFGAWGDALRHASTPGAPAGDDPGSWQRLFDWWGQLLPEQAQGAPELTPICCQVDDWMMENLPPSIRWERTQTLGRGGAVCDFRWRRVPKAF